MCDQEINATCSEKNVQNVAKQITSPSYVNKSLVGGRKGRKERIHRVGDPKTSLNSSDEQYCSTISLENLEEQSVNNVDSQPIKSKIFATMEIKNQPVRF